MRAAVIVAAPAQYFDSLQQLRAVTVFIAIAGFMALFGLALVSSRSAAR